jgi:hypothetical protein
MQAGGKHGHCHPEAVLSAFYVMRLEDTYNERVDTRKHSMSPGSYREWREVLLLEAFLQTYLRVIINKGDIHVPSSYPRKVSFQTAPLIDVYTVQQS